MILDKNMFVCLLQSSVLYKQNKPNKYMDWNLSFFFWTEKIPPDFLSCLMGVTSIMEKSWQ